MERNCFPGGHVEEHKSIVDSVIREVKEETGLSISNLKLCGIKQWFDDECRNICFLFRTSSYDGQLLSSDEGSVFWVKISELRKMNLAHTFSEMIDVFENVKLCEIYLCGNLDNNIQLK